jgi:REP element-mobilizing transposase RayT
MPRQLRHHVPGGWYHLTTRGIGRRTIFETDRDREHFLELISGMVERYSVILHAYVLMENHYHLLVESPEGNVSRAMQWLNTSYGVWFNLKHERSGALFQSRFKSVPVDNEGTWAFGCALYVHLNPVRIKVLGLGKGERSREKAGMLPEEPRPEVVLARLEKLRNHRWSSYPAYAGYAERPSWLTCDELWRRACDRKGADPKKEYREWLESYLKQGIEEKLFAQMKSALVVGSARFKADVRRQVLKGAGGRTDERRWRRLLPFGEVAGAVSEMKGEPWDGFVNRYGDTGRDLAIFVARKRCGLTLREIGEHAGMKDKAVSYACTAIGKRLETDLELGLLYRRVLEKLGEIET